MDEAARLLDPVEEFIEQIGLFTQTEGGPRIAGRIFGLAIIENRPLSLQEFADRLQVSKASVSTNARQLAGIGLLRRTTRPGSREDLYQLPPDPYRELLSSIANNMQNKAEVIEEIEARFSDDQVEIRNRVHHLAEFYKSSAEVLVDWYAKLPPAP